MSDNTASPQLLEPALPGAWIAKHRRIWQMDFLNADKLASFGHDRGLASFREQDVIQLWQLGLIKADLITSRRKLRLVGLVDRGTDRYGCHMYSDERRLLQRRQGWGNARKNLNPLQKGVKLLFHPFRYYVLYEINQLLKLDISSIQTLYQEHYPSLLEFCLTKFNRFSRSDNFTCIINTWNDVTSLAIVTEPCFYERIFQSMRVLLSDIDDTDNWMIQIRQEIEEYWEQDVQKLYQSIGKDRLEEIRQDLCWATRMLDSNRWVHTLLCLGEGKFRIELKGCLGGALLLRTMAEMLRRAAEEALEITLREEDELGEWGPKDVKETIYGSNRLMDDQQAAEVFASQHGLNYKSRIHWYCEGNTEYGALSSFFKMMGVGIRVTNLHGLIKERKSMVTFFRDSLRSDIKDHVYSLVVIDGDVRENVKILESAARNNRISEDDGIFGTFFISDPDFEFANFEVQELEEILWKMIGNKPTQEARELLHSYVTGAKKSEEFFEGVEYVAQALPQLIQLDKGEKWGEELIKFAWEHQFKQGRKRQIIEAIELALYWETTTKLERYETAKKTNMVDPQTGRLIKRSS